ncbi:hypothetical protein D3C73_788520 [compost metagenome]
MEVFQQKGFHLLSDSLQLCFIGFYSEIDNTCQHIINLRGECTMAVASYFLHYIHHDEMQQLDLMRIGIFVICFILAVMIDMEQ